ncbi:xanthine dehydrogenase accessory protein XdhC [Fulvimarina sp. 2208YS6-2-32]|uniref:Xanthine dehydrogenase accessory protein XdhC n=1 Tax=Fulvimarina uroteuthidis TaxID=3098149 RepID=A0ABU5HZS4_9HYPH|nr:xanthine dehydrogenase accessory protein XdhC [Fulvimarina sp. 2208YS6-2-32]MDY8108630.1 xanthine dehydrogenase accessory protein XdhC [Fulvimarina sp. 2208YS6-2-32]
MVAPFGILVTVLTAEGSTPREAGATLEVTEAGQRGTIGGGRLEFDAIDLARHMLKSGAVRETRSIALGPRIGQCCGGRVELLFERVTEALAERKARDAEAARAAQASVYLFGAGHTGSALAAALAPLPLQTTLIDSRAHALAAVPETIRTIAAAMPESLVAAAPPGSAFVVMTHDHALDFLIAAAALERRDAAYVGMIGSATKRARFGSYLGELGRKADLARLTLPLGGSALRDKRPAVIAALTAAELCTCLLSYHQKTLPVRLADAPL